MFKLDQVEEIAQLLVEKKCRILTFYGPLGAGKTTLIKAFLKKKGVKEDVTSPTFAYVNTYKNDNGEVFYHFDLYRLSSLNDFLSSGFDEYLSDDATVIIEWPSIIEELLREKEIDGGVCRVELGYDENDLSVRHVNIS